MNGNRPFGRPSGRPFSSGSSSFDDDDDDDEPFESDPREAEAARAREQSSTSRPAAPSRAAPGVKRDAGFGDKPGGGFGNKPSSGLGNKPGSGFGDKPGSGFGDKRGTGFGAKRGTGFGGGFGVRSGAKSGAEPGELTYSSDSRRPRGPGAGRYTSARDERRAAAPVDDADGASPIDGAPDPQATERAPRRSERQQARDAALGFKRSLRGRALGYLSRREHSRSELARKLAPFVEESDGEQAVEQLLDALAREGWLSDSRFAESVVNRRAARFGAARIVGELKQHKVDGELVQELGAALRETEWTRIQDVWRRKFGTLAITPQERAKQARFLAARGFSRDLIMRILKVGNDALPEEE